MQGSNSSTKSLWQLLSPHKPNNSTFAGITLLVLLATSLELVLPLYSSYLVDSITKEGLSAVIIGGLILIVVAAAIFEAILAWYSGKVGQRINFKLRYSLIGRLLNSQTESLAQEHSAELSARVVNDSKEVKSVLAEDLMGLISGLVSLLAVITIMFILDWRLTLVLVSCVLLGFIVITPLALMMNGIGKASQTAEANLLKYVTEWLRYGKLVKSHNAAQQLQTKSTALLNDCFTHEMRATKVLALIGPITNLVLMVSMVAILGFSAYWLQQGTMTLGTVTAFLMYLFGLTFPLMAMAMFFSNLNKAAGAAARLSEISQLPVEHSDSSKKLQKIKELSFNNLSFSRDDKMILDNINYQFNSAGLSIIVGASGSGKSTLISQLLGFYPETHPNVLINGHTIADYNLRSLRQAIAWVDQEPKLLHATIRENLTLGLDADIDDSEMTNTLLSVGLASWLDRIEHNFDAIVSEQAHQFSGGEKQHFAIARAILRKSQVILLDEPTSALDDKNKVELMTILRELAKTRRIIMVSHHIDLIETDDDVIQLANGKIVESLVGLA